jgi:amino acid transporter/nucleotide-binding universal stress UspA family protein
MDARENNGGKAGLVRTLGPGSIVLMGIGSLLGGGIFTLLGPAAGLVGPGLFLAMVVGAGIAYLNLQMYLALGTTFPEAGGGYLWVRKGLGNFHGFMAGWVSWFAHAAACGVYALSFGYYAIEILDLAGVTLPAGGHAHLTKGIALSAVAVFAYVNWKGARSTGTAGNVITVALLAILALFIGSGLAAMGGSAEPLARFDPLLPYGWFGILAAASFFYIAFEGSEIQVQAGEEAKDPARDLRIGLIGSWAVVSAIYVLVSVVIIGATVAEGRPVWEALSVFGEGAIVEAAKGFMPFGGALMIVGGLLANLAALNTTIYSSSHVSFALARDRNVWSHLAHIHLKNFTPHLAVAASALLVAAMVIFLPLFDVASAASLLFVLLFLQLNVAGIAIHYVFPGTKWNYRIPFFPATPILAIVLYAMLALTMLRINATAWAVTAVWFLLGLVNYYSYSLVKGRERFENEILYEEAVRIGPKTGKRILVPMSPDAAAADLRPMTDLAISLAAKFGGEVVFAMIHEAEAGVGGAAITHDRQALENVKAWVEDFNRRTPGRERDVNFHNLILAGASVADVILDVVRMEECDLVIMGWEGYTRTKGTIFGGKIDRILRESRCDLLIVKDPGPVRSLIVAANPKAKNPSLPLVGEIVAALRDGYAPRTELFCVLGRQVPAYFTPNPGPVLAKLGLPPEAFDTIRFSESGSIGRSLIDEAKAVGADLVIVGAAKAKALKDIRFGPIPEFLAKNLSGSLYIVKGHLGPARAFWERVREALRADPSEPPRP